MSEVKDDDFHVFDEKMSTSPSSKARNDHSLLDSVMTVSNNGSSVELPGAVEEQACNLKPETKERKSISDDLRVMELSEADDNSMNISFKKDLQNSTRLTSPKQTDILCVDKDEYSENKMSVPISPIRLRNPLLDQYLDSNSSCRKITRAEPNQVLLVSNPSEEASDVFQPTLKPEEFVTKKTNFEGCSMISNVTDETSVFKIPKVPPIKVKRPEKSVSDLYEAFLKTQGTGATNKIAAEFHSSLRKADSDEPDLERVSGPRTRATSSDGTLETKHYIEGQFQSDIGPIERTSSCQDLSKNTKDKLARDHLVQNIDLIVKEYEKMMAAYSFDTPAEEEHLKDFRIKCVLKLNMYQSSMEEFLDEVRNMMSSPIINASMIGLKASNVHQAALEFEKVWKEHHNLVENNVNSITVAKMGPHFYLCYEYFHKLSIAINEYLSFLPADYPNQYKDS